MTVLDFGPIYTETGNLIQLEYAQKCTSNGSTIIGITFNNGILIATENPIESPLHKDDAINRIQKVTPGIMMAWTGLMTDGKVVYEYIKDVIFSEAESLDAEISPGFYKKVLSEYLSIYTIYFGCRPVGCDFLSAVKYGNKHFLIGTESSSKGTFCKAAAYGKGSQRAKTELEKLDFEVFDLKLAIDNAVRILYKSYDPLKDKDFNIQISYICADDNYEIKNVSKEDISLCVDQYKDLSIDE